MTDPVHEKLAPGSHVAALKDVQLQYYVAGKGPVLLLPSPGWGPSVKYIMPLPVFEKYFTVVYFDTRHSGLSTGPDDPTQYHLDNFVADIDGLRNFLGLQQMYLAGHSAGGHQALEYAIRHGEHLLGLISLDAIVAPDELRMAEMVKRIQEKKSEPFYERHPDIYENAAAFFSGSYAGKKLETLAEILDIIGYFYFKNPELAAAAFKDLDLNSVVYGYTMSTGFQGKNMLPELHMIKVPTLIVVGQDDFICDPVSQSARIYQQIDSSTLELISNCGHFPWIEQPEQFEHVCESWFIQQGLTAH